MGFLLRVLINAAALWVAASLIPGIALGGLGHTLLAALVLGIINAVVRPILIFLTLPITLVTLGLFIFVLNAFCLWLTSRLVPGFEVHGFGAAVPRAPGVSPRSRGPTAEITNAPGDAAPNPRTPQKKEEHTSRLHSLAYLGLRLLLEKK